MTRSSADEKLLSMPLDDLAKLISNLLSMQRDSTLFEMAASLLAQCSLTQDCLLPQMAETPEVRGRAVQGLLHWSVDTLKREGANDLTEQKWRGYNSLFYPYLDQNSRTFPALAEQMQISKEWLDEVRQRAIKTVAERLQVELKSPTDSGARKIYGIRRFYEALAPIDQRIICLMAVFQDPITVPVLQRLTKKLCEENLPIPSKELLLSGLVIQEPNNKTLKVREEACVTILSYIPFAERATFHQIISAYHFDQAEYLSALHHCQLLREIGTYTHIEAFLIDRYDVFVAERHADELLNLLVKCTWNQDFAETWAHLKIMAGDIAVLANEADIDAAIGQYLLVLDPDKAQKIGVYYRALAHHKIARAFESRNFLDESFRHYSAGIKLLEETREHDSLRAAMYIDRAWIFIQERLQLKLVEENLAQAEILIPNEDNEQRVKLHTAKCQVAWIRGEEEQDIEKKRKWKETEIVEGQRAWQAAIATEDAHLKIMTANNLGEVYAWDGDHERGLEYLEKALALATLIDDQQNIAKVSKTMGACHFFMGQWSIAITHYEKAYIILKAKKDLNWLGEVCHDLAEAYVELGLSETEKNYQKRFEVGRRFYNEGKKIAHDMLADRLFLDLDALNQKYNGIFDQRESRLQRIFERQQRALRYIQVHGSITSKQYGGLNDVKRPMPERHLEDLTEKGITERIGSGAGTHYIKTQPISGENA